MTDESKKDISISSGDVHHRQDLSSEESESDSDLSLREDLGEQLRLAEERACDFSDQDEPSNNNISPDKDPSEDQPARDVYKNITIETIETIETTIEMDMESDDDEKIYGNQNISVGDVLVVKGEPVLVDQAKALVRSSSSGIGAVIFSTLIKCFLFQQRLSLRRGCCLGKRKGGLSRQGRGRRVRVRWMYSLKMSGGCWVNWTRQGRGTTLRRGIVK